MFARFLWNNTSVVKLVHVWTRAAPMLHFLTSGGGEGAAGHDDVNAWAFLLKKKAKKTKNKQWVMLKEIKC